MTSELPLEAVVSPPDIGDSIQMLNERVTTRRADRLRDAVRVTLIVVKDSGTYAVCVYLGVRVNISGIG